MRLEGYSGYELAKSIQTHSILARNIVVVGYYSTMCHQPLLESWDDVVVVVEDEFRSQHCLTNH